MFGVYGFTLPKSGIICYSKIIDNGHIRSKRTTRARTLVIFDGNLIDSEGGRLSNPSVYPESQKFPVEPDLAK